MNIEDVNTITKSKDGVSSNEVEINWTYYSSLPKLVRHISWILKLKRNWLIWKRGEKDRENFTQLSTKDTHNGLETLIKNAQHQSFPLEITNLLSQRSVNCNSKILSLSPFIDKKNILGVGGRLKNANLHADAEHQVILSRHHHLSKLIISDIHYKNAHIGREHTLYLLRNKYWIPACCGIIRKILSNCLYCKRVNLRPKTQIMANLAKERLLVYDKPFVSTAVDYFGPFLVKHSKTTRRNQAFTKR